MTGNEMNTLMQDVAAWEALERAAGHDPDALDYPEDVGERIERMGEENGAELYAGIVEWEPVDRPTDA